MADSKISDLSDGSPLVSTDRIPLARSPFGSVDNAYLPGSALLALAGKVVGRGYAEYATNTDLSTTIPLDDTSPTSSEGTEILSVTISTTSATQKLRCRFQGVVGCNNQTPIAAMFAGSTNIGDTLNSAADVYAGAGEFSLVIEVEITPGAAQSNTISVRVGANTGTIRMNGTTSARYFGGAMKATLVVEVIEP